MLHRLVLLKMFFLLAAAGSATADNVADQLRLSLSDLDDLLTCC